MPADCVDVYSESVDLEVDPIETECLDQTEDTFAEERVDAECCPGLEQDRKDRIAEDLGISVSRTSKQKDERWSEGDRLSAKDFIGTYQCDKSIGPLHPMFDIYRREKFKVFRNPTQQVSRAISRVK